MTELELTYSPYSIKLKTPFITSKNTIKERKGFIISIKNEKGNEGLGDAAPFPDFGSESHEEAEKTLEGLSLKINIDIHVVKESTKEILRLFDHLPALRHGLEQALLNLICKEKNVSLNNLLDIKLKKRINVNAAIGFLPPDEAASKATELVNKGFKTLKVKTGRDSFDEDFKTIESIMNTVGDKIKIRIDTNGKWELRNAAEYLKQLEQFNLEYAEQPVSSLQDFIALKKYTSVPLAPDESVRDKKSTEEFIESKAADVLILKPMMIGGLIPTLEIIKLAEDNKIIPVITSSFESAIGRTNAVIAAAVVKSNVAHGLSVSQYYESDIAEDHYPVKDGMIAL
jgi:o-succinylbenzoate synthase